MRPHAGLETPLHMVSLIPRQLDVARVLSEHGAALDAKDKEGRTPLQLSLERGTDEVTRLLSGNWFKTGIKCNVTRMMYCRPRRGNCAVRIVSVLFDIFLLDQLLGINDVRLDLNSKVIWWVGHDPENDVRGCTG